MLKQKLCLLVFLILGGMFLAEVASAVPPDLQFKVVDLGMPTGINDAVAIAMNNHNPAAVVGNGSSSDNKLHAILWDQSQDGGTVLPLLAGYDYSYACGINDAAQVVGYCFNSSTNLYQACVWQGGGGPGPGKSHRSRSGKLHPGIRDQQPGASGGRSQTGQFE